MEKRLTIAFVVLLACSAPALAQGTRACMVNGKKVYTQFVGECQDAAQTEISRSGTTRVVERSLSPVERDKAERDRALAEHAKQEELRVRKNEALLLKRFPDVAAHNRARAAAIEDSTRTIAASEDRLKQLATERKKLADEAEFYLKRPMPADLRARIESNEAAAAGQRAALQQQRDELARVNASYDSELALLKRLWAQT